MKRTTRRLSTKSLFLLFAVSSVGSLQAGDCNQNGTPDAKDISSGASLDCNADTVPDECELVPWDYVLAVQTQPSSPRDVLITDADGDGILDFLTSNGESTLSVFLSRGDGTFAEPVESPAGGAMRHGFHAVDIEGDGDPDVIAPIASVISIVENNGTGTLLPPRSLTVGGALRAVLGGDLTGDAAPELIVADSQGNFSVFRNAGDGSFAEGIPITVDDATSAVALLDLDLDGALDLAVGRKLGSGIHTLAGTGDAAFEPAVALDVGDPRPVQLVPGDFDNDGSPDLATASNAGIVILSNEGDGTFSAARLSGFPTRSISALDVDHDGREDVVVVGFDTRALFMLTNLGNGVFRKQFLAELDSPLRSAALGDLDEDGDVDAVVTTTQLTETTVILNGVEAAETAQQPETATVIMGSEPHSATIADVDGDSHPDVITSNGGCDNLSVLRSIEGGAFEGPANFPLIGAQHMNSISTGDFDGDLKPDLAAADLGGRIQVLLNAENRLFGPATSYEISRPFMITTADVDGDSHIDLLGVDEASLLTILFNDGSGGFGESKLELRVGIRPLAVAAGDLDGDGDTDLVTANEVSADLSLFLGSGARTFPDPVSLPVLGEPRYVLMADLDTDGDLDLATADSVTNAVSVFRNRGDATFDEQVGLPLGLRPYSVISADTNSDGHLDLVTTNEEASSISVLLGNGEGDFAAPVHRPAGEGPRFTVAGDADGDGDTDLVCAARQGRNLTVYFNYTPLPEENYRESLCTRLDFHALSRVTAPASVFERVTKYLVPTGGDPDSLATLFLAPRFESHLEFLIAVFPERFGALDEEGFTRLVAQRASREYFAGEIGRIRTAKGVSYGFRPLNAGVEPLSLVEAEALFAGLRDGFQLVPLGYYPQTREERDVAAGWENPSFPILSAEEEPTGTRFRRGDVDANGRVAVTDAIVLVTFLFRDGITPTCLKSGDTDDSGRINLVDVLGLVSFLFRDGTAPREPLQSCGFDTTADDLGCETFAPCG